MLYYIYDGSFPGLLCALQRAVQDEVEPCIRAHGLEQRSLFAREIVIPTCSRQGEVFLKEVRETISSRAVQSLFYGFLSQERDCEQLLLKYLRRGNVLGRDMEYSMDATVWAVQTMCDRVIKEKHRLHGLLRFQVLADSVLHAFCSPDHNIIALLAPHFVRRMPGEPWVIHDEKRGMAVFYDGKDWSLQEDRERPKGEEDSYQSLWQTYMHHIAIPQRHNKALQTKAMPRRYWQYLPEMAL